LKQFASCISCSDKQQREVWGRKTWCHKKAVRKRNNSLAQVISGEIKPCKRYLLRETEGDKIEYNRYTAIEKRTERQNRREIWNDFVTKLQKKLKPKAYKISRILKYDVVEHVKINPIKKETWLYYF
jgi:hypothetical protein